MTDEKRKLVDEYWDHQRTRQRAWVRMMTASHLLIGERLPGCIEQLQMESMLAADAMTTAEHAADLVKHAISEVDRSIDHALTVAMLAAAKEGR